MTRRINPRDQQFDPEDAVILGAERPLHVEVPKLDGWVWLSQREIMPNTFSPTRLGCIARQSLDGLDNRGEAVPCRIVLMSGDIPSR